MMITSFKLRNGKHPQKKILGTKLMKKIMSFGLAAAFIAVSIMSAQAMVRYEDKYPKKSGKCESPGLLTMPRLVTPSIRTAKCAANFSRFISR